MSVDAPRRRGETGSVLLLFPAAVLIVVVLGSLAVDTAVVHLRQRQLVDAASAAASDAASQAVDVEHYRRTGEVRLAPGLVREVVLESLVFHGVIPLLDAPPQAQLVGGDQIEVRLVGRARHVLSAALPGGRREVIVTATGRATISIDP